MRTRRHPSRSTSRIASLTFGMNLGSANARQDQVVVLELGCLHWSRLLRAEVQCCRNVLGAIIDGRQFSATAAGEFPFPAQPFWYNSDPYLKNTHANAEESIPPLPAARRPRRSCLRRRNRPHPRAHSEGFGKQGGVLKKRDTIFEGNFGMPRRRTRNA